MAPSLLSKVKASQRRYFRYARLALMAGKIRSKESVRDAATLSKPSTQPWSLAVVCGIAVYVIIDIVLTILRPDYNWLHNAESDFGRGPYFWLMDINFILRYLFSLSLVKMLWTQFPKDKSLKRATYWIVLWALTSGLLAFFADNPYGYRPLWSGRIHLLFALIAFVSVIVGMVLITRRLTSLSVNLAIKNILIGLTVLACITLLLLGHSGFRPDNFGGLYERIFLFSVLAWEGLLAVTSRKTA